MRSIRFLIVVIGLVFSISRAASPDDAPVRSGRAVIVVGLPGDALYRKQFPEIVKVWHKWLSSSAGFRDEDVVVLGDDCGDKGLKELIRSAADRESLEKSFRDIATSLKPDDRFWLLMLGHGNYDGRRAWFHLPGPDLDDRQWRDLLKPVPCREQVLWCTFPASGSFLKSLSAKQRIVITATEPASEFNATEFPAALYGVVQQPKDELDVDADGKLSVRELFQRTAENVEARFAADKRLPTEHAQLDDTGDGRAAELAALLKGDADDGKLAAETFVP